MEPKFETFKICNKIAERSNSLMCHLNKSFRILWAQFIFHLFIQSRPSLTSQSKFNFRSAIYCITFFMFAHKPANFLLPPPRAKLERHEIMAFRWSQKQSTPVVSKKSANGRIMTGKHQRHSRDAHISGPETENKLTNERFELKNEFAICLVSISLFFLFLNSKHLHEKINLKFKSLRS